MSHISFAFEIAGKTITPSEIKDKELEADIRDVVGSILDCVGDLVCPEHNEAPRFLCRGDNFDEISVETFGCCDNLIKEVKRRMKL